MGLAKETGDRAWRDFVVANSPGSGRNWPSKVEIREFVGVVDQEIIALQTSQPGGIVGFRTGAQMDAASGDYAANIIAEVWDDDTSPSRNGVYRRVIAEPPGPWEYLGPIGIIALALRVDAQDEKIAGMITASAVAADPPWMTVWMIDYAGNRQPLGDGGVFYDPAITGIRSDGLSIRVGAEDQDGAWVQDTAGNRVFLTVPADTTETASAESLFSDERYAWAEARGAAMSLMMNEADVSGFAVVQPGMNLIFTTGQSFAAGSDAQRNYLTAEVIALKGCVFDSRTVGPESRCVAAGAVFTPFADASVTASITGDVMTVTATDPRGPLEVGQALTGTGVAPDTEIVADLGGGDWQVTPGGQTVASTTILASALKLWPIQERFIGPTNQDLIYTPAEVAAGDYPTNARGGTPETIRDFGFQWLRRDWLLQDQTTADPSYFTLSINHAKTDGSLAELGTGDGLLRVQSAMAVVAEAYGRLAVSPLPGANFLAIVMNHGEADEGAGTADYITPLQAFDDNIVAAWEAEFGPVAARPWFVQHQVGGPRYGSAEMICAIQQVETMLDLTGDNRNKTVISAKYEAPSAYFVPAPHPNAGDGHPLLAGKAYFGFREACAIHYLTDRQQYYWLPFPYEVYAEGDRFLLIVPCMVPPIRAVPMVSGDLIVFLTGLGVSFENEVGAENAVIQARVVGGPWNYLIEGRCAAPIQPGIKLKTGKRLLPAHPGLTNIRDSFSVANWPLDLPFNKNQTTYAGGYVDNPQENERGRYIEDIPGWTGKPDLGNAMVRYEITVQAFPE